MYKRKNLCNEYEMIYCHLVYEKGLTRSEVIKFHTRGVCWDNASMESANGVIKTECLYNKFGKSKFKNRQIPIDEGVAEIAPFIEYYNNERSKQSLGGLSPVQFRKQNSKGIYLMVIKD